MKLKNQILKYLKKHPEGTMILDLADSLEVHRHTARKYVYILREEGNVNVRKVGVAKLCYAN